MDVDVVARGGHRHAVAVEGVGLAEHVLLALGALRLVKKIKLKMKNENDVRPRAREREREDEWKGLVTFLEALTRDHTRIDCLYGLEVLLRFIFFKKTKKTKK